MGIKILKAFAWFQIIVGCAGLLFFGIFTLLDIMFAIANGFMATQGLFFYIPISLWFFVSGILLKRDSLIGKIMSVVTLLFILLVIAITPALMRFMTKGLRP